MATVFLVQEPRSLHRNGTVVPRDLSSAQRYGKIIPVLSQGEQPSLTPGPCLHKMLRELREFDTENDFLCYAGGDPMSLGLALLALRENGRKEVSVLRWDRERDTSGNKTQGGYYVPIRVPLYI